MLCSLSLSLRSSNPGLLALLTLLIIPVAIGLALLFWCACRPQKPVCQPCMPVCCPQYITEPVCMPMPAPASCEPVCCHPPAAIMVTNQGAAY